MCSFDLQWPIIHLKGSKLHMHGKCMTLGGESTGFICPIQRQAVVRLYHMDYIADGEAGLYEFMSH